jgi:hypothetical protein
MTIMTGRAMLTFSHTLSFAFFHSTGSPGIVLGKGDNKDGKGKSNKGKGMDSYSEQLFLTHSFCPLTGSQYHACRAGSGWNVGSGQVELGPVRLLGHWVGSGHRVGSSPVESLGWVIGLGRVVGLGRWALAREMVTTTSRVMCNCIWFTVYIK